MNVAADSENAARKCCRLKLKGQQKKATYPDDGVDVEVSVYPAPPLGSREVKFGFV